MPARRNHATVAVIGQGPSASGWKNALRRGGRSLAELYCADWAVIGQCAALANLIGIEPGLLCAEVDRFNLNPRWTGKAGKGDRFDAVAGRRRAARIALMPFTHLVLLGKAVAGCFGFEAEFLETIERGGKRYLIFPHPSGINRWWNERDNVGRARHALRRFLKSSRCPSRSPRRARSRPPPECAAKRN